MNRRLAFATAFVLGFTVISWLWFNPPGYFGWCAFALTTYNSIPRPISDFQIRPDGDILRVQKTHDIRHQDLLWLLDSRPDVLIISTGWDGRVQVSKDISSTRDIEVLILRNADARIRYNELRRAGERVAIHFHSTC